MSRLILPGPRQPVVASSVAEATPQTDGARILHPGQLVPMMLANGAPVNYTVAHKPGAVLLALSVGPIGIPLEMTAAEARKLLENLAAAIDAADPPAVVLTDPSAGPTGETLHLTSTESTIDYRLHWPPREDDILPFLPAEAVADSPAGAPTEDIIEPGMRLAVVG